DPFGWVVSSTRSLRAADRVFPVEQRPRNPCIPPSCGPGASGLWGERGGDRLATPPHEASRPRSGPTRSRPPSARATATSRAHPPHGALRWGARLHPNLLAAAQPEDTTEPSARLGSPTQLPRQVCRTAS